MDEEIKQVKKIINELEKVLGKSIKLDFLDYKMKGAQQKRE